MNVTQKQLAVCLSKAIRNQEFTKDVEIEIDDLMEEAKTHDVRGLVYKVLKAQYDLSAYQKEIVLQSYTQSRYFQLALQTLSKLKEAGIRVVLLKGSVLKSLYPMPDLRTMGDVDVLVPKHQLTDVHQALTELGYTKRESHNEKHDVYDGQGFHLEVHWSLVNTSRQQGSEDFETALWHQLQEVSISNQTFFTLSNEDFLIHLLIHVADHMRSSGFGIRQLCDITLWIEHHPDLDWSLVEQQLETLKLTRFSLYLFLICHRLLGLELREEWGSEVIEERVINDFMTVIFENGVHGKREKNQHFGNNLAYKIAQEGSIWVRLRLLFPSLKSLPEYYGYAHRYPLLLPLAWIHRWVRLLQFDYTFVYKVATIFKSPNLKLAKRQSSLLVALDLVDEV